MCGTGEIDLNAKFRMESWKYISHRTFAFDDLSVSTRLQNRAFIVILDLRHSG